MSRALQRFIWPRMSAAGVGPQAARVVFFFRAPLKQELAFLIKNKNGKCPMQFSILMRFYFFFHSYLFIIFVNQNNFFHNIMPRVGIEPTTISLRGSCPARLASLCAHQDSNLEPFA